MRPYYIKELIIHNDKQITIGLYEDIQYADGKGRYINLIAKPPKSVFDKSQPSLFDSLNLKVDGLIHIDTSQISQSSVSSWLSSDSSVVSKVE